MKRARLFLCAVQFCGAFLQAQSAGSLTGLITDLTTNQPLVGANVMIEGTTLGAATDIGGHYRIPGIPVGSYTLRVTMMGYKSLARANVHVVPQRETIANVALESTVLEGEVVVFTAGFFERARDAVVSSRSVDIEEIRSDPVGAYDVFRMMEALPSVASGTDQLNEIIVRGGAPGENLFVMDHLEIPYPNHFPQSQLMSGGPVTMVNTEFLERVDFYAGAFPARYGSKVSSVMDITLREGNRRRHLAEFNFNMSGVGMLAEGPLTTNGSYILSYNRSFLDLVIKSIGMAAIPRYSSLQTKVAYSLSPRQKLVLNVLTGDDVIALTGETEGEKPGTILVDFSSNQYTVGLTYKNLFSTRGYLLASLGRNRTVFDVDVSKVHTGGGQQDFFLKDDIETENTLKMDIVYQLKDDLELSSGLKIKRAALNFSDTYNQDPVIRYKYARDDTAPLDTVSRDYFIDNIFNNPDAVIDTFSILSPGVTWDRDDKAGIWTSGLYGQVRWLPTSRLELIAGGRVEQSSLLAETTFSPRIGLSFALTDIVKVNTSAGRYYQAPFYDQLIEYESSEEKLTSYYADQAVIGLEALFREDFRGTLEVFGRRYEDMALQYADTTPDTTDSFSHWVNAGAGHSYGVEVYLQKKYTNRWYGSCSYAWSVAEGIDPRYPGKDRTYPWDFDFRHVLTIIGGYKIKYMDYDWYQRYKQTVWARFLSWIPVAPSDEFEISFRGRYVGGRPYTPNYYDHNTRTWNTFRTQELNTHRMRDYIRFDVMLIQRFYFKKMNLVAFWDIMNIFDRNNPWMWQYYEDGTKEMVWQYKTFPVGGLVLEF